MNRDFAEKSLAHQAVDVEEDHHSLIHRREALHEIGLDSCAEIGGGLTFFRVDITYFGHGIDDEPERALAALGGDAYDDHNGRRTELRSGHSEAPAQVDDRHD